jgi:hypothetical protein
MVHYMRMPHNVLISFPRSGTDFLCSSFLGQQTIRYYREYFNPICNEPRAQALVRGFGDERFEFFSQIMTEISNDAFWSILADTWGHDGYNTTKENFSATKLHHFVPIFNIVILARKIQHTFPTSRPDYIAPIASSFMLSGPYRSLPLAMELNEIRSFMTNLAFLGPQELSLAAYAVQHFILVDASVRFGIPIIRYEDMITKSGPALEDVLCSLEAFNIDVPALARVIEDSRSLADADLDARRQRFHQLGYDRKIDRLCRFMIDTTPHLRAGLEACFY